MRHGKLFMGCWLSHGNMVKRTPEQIKRRCVSSSLLFREETNLHKHDQPLIATTTNKVQSEKQWSQGRASAREGGTWISGAQIQGCAPKCLCCSPKHPWFPRELPKW